MCRAAFVHARLSSSLLCTQWKGHTLPANQFKSYVPCESSKVAPGNGVAFPFKLIVGRCVGGPYFGCPRGLMRQLLGYFRALLSLQSVLYT